MRTLRPRVAESALALLLAACGPDSSPAAKPATPPAATSPAPVAPAPSPTPPKPAPAPAVETPHVAAPAPAAAERPRVLSDQWYRTLSDGQPSGWYHVIWTRSTYEGKPTVHDRTESFSSTTRMMGGHPDSFVVHTYSDLERTEDGLWLHVESRTIQGDRLTDGATTWTGSGYEWTNHVAGMEEKRVVACDAPCPVDPEAFLSAKLQRGEVKVGAHYEYKTPNFEGSRMDTVSLDVEARETITVQSGKFDCLRVKEKVTGAPAQQTWWFDGAGVLRRQSSGRSEIVASTERAARDLNEGGAVFSITVAADPEMPRCTSLDKAVVDVTLKPREGVEMPDFPSTPFSHEVSRKGDVIRLELTAHDEPGEAIALPVKDPKFAKYLERTNILCWDAPLVQAAMKEAVGGEKDAREVVRKILRYVQVTLRTDQEPIPNPTATEILELGSGFCSEHCVLFVTLCRAAGVPARRLSGYAQVGDMWGGHSFAEVWLGRWVGCDPTTNDFGTKARYIAFGWDDDADSFPGVVSSRAGNGRMSIRTVEFTEGKRTWKTDELDDQSEREDALSGLAFAEPPPGWTVHVEHDAGRRRVGARVTAPGVRADFSVVAGFGDLPCDVLAGKMMHGMKTSKFAGRDVLREDIAVQGHVTVQLTIPYKRRMMTVRVRVEDAKKADAALAVLEKLVAPSFE
jgi:transglutaminase-like putative cysteine protease